LFLEDLGVDLNEGDREGLAAVRWLAEMHGTWWGRAAELRALGCLGEHGLLLLEGRAHRPPPSRRAGHRQAVRWLTA
jgi:hypothetical protein